MGHRPIAIMPIPFPSPSSTIPILGQQIVVEGYTVTTVTRCQCEAGGSPVLLTMTVSAAGIASAPSACARCRTGYAIQGTQQDDQGRLLFQIAVLSQGSSVVS